MERIAGRAPPRRRAHGRDHAARRRARLRQEPGCGRGGATYRRNGAIGTLASTRGRAGVPRRRPARERGQRTRRGTALWALRGGALRRAGEIARSGTAPRRWNARCPRSARNRDRSRRRRRGARCRLQVRPITAPSGARCGGDPREACRSAVAADQCDAIHRIVGARRTRRLDDGDPRATGRKPPCRGGRPAGRAPRWVERDGLTSAPCPLGIGRVGCRRTGVADHQPTRPCIGDPLS